MSHVPELEAGGVHPEEYLGDGLYASFDGDTVRLRAPRETGDHIVWLDRALWNALGQFAVRSWRSAGYGVPQHVARPDFGESEHWHEGVRLTCSRVAPGLTLHDLTMIFERASKEAAPRDHLSANPSKWPTVRGVSAVTDALLDAIYSHDDAPTLARKTLEENP